MTIQLEKLIVRRICSNDKDLFGEALSVFGRAFGEEETYDKHRPDSGYIDELLRTDTFVAVVAIYGGHVIGALAAYELKKFEQKRSEIYIYDLAVEEAYRRRGVAKELLRHITEYAVKINAHAVFVQADRDDMPAISLYESCGIKEEVLHFDLLLPKITTDENK